MKRATTRENVMELVTRVPVTSRQSTTLLCHPAPYKWPLANGNGIWSGMVLFT